MGFFPPPGGEAGANFIHLLFYSFTFFSPLAKTLPLSANGNPGVCVCVCVFCSEATRLTSVKLQDTALHFLSTWGRLITSLPPWNSTSEGSCLERGEVLTLYLEKRDGGKGSY
jgi:hypothetical protein